MFPMMHSRLLLICCVVYSVICLSSAGPYCKGQYETPVECIDQCQTCEYKNGGCAQPAVCIPGCDCIPGFFRNKQNQCIPAAFCPAVCGPNSKPSDCVFCEPTCRNPKPQACAQSCAKGCACDDGFLKDDNGNCIPKNACPTVCGPNSKPSDCVFCEPTCRNPKPQVCAQSCTKGCACDDGFLKDDNGNCVPKYECPIVCGPNSKPSDCVSLCEPTCRNRKPGFCPQACTRGCACDDGFLKDDNGNCVPENKCPNQCKSDEQYYPDIPDCKNTCENYNNPGAICPQYFAARPGCFCAAGLVKRQDGKCVKPENCFPPGPPQQCQAGEFPVECIDRCQRCEYKNGNCSQILICTPGCNCVPGFLRDSTNKCIPADFCPAVCGPNSKPSDCVFCEPTCRNPKPQVCAQSCTKGCACDDGFLKDDNGNCIPEYECPIVCGPNSKPSDCVSLCEPTCRKRKPGFCPQSCTRGCACDDGFLKDDNGNCVPENKCPTPAQQCGQYERPVECIDQCQTCEYKNGGCAQPAACIPGCDCIPGFFRNKQKQCIPAAFCPAPIPTQQCGVYERPVECIDQCQTCKYKNGGCVQPAVCIPGCDCIPGFFRNEKNQCIPAAQCPGPAQQCPAGEIPVPCIDGCQRCEYKNGNCSQIQVCTPGCNCLPGFLRDSTNKCIPADFCPGNPCLQEKDSGPCYGSFPRFYYNKKTGQCEKFIYGGCGGNSNNFEYKELCEAACKGPGPTQQCGQYERPVECIDQCQICEYRNGGVCAKAAVCIPGCDCIPGFLRNKQKQCIPAAFCPGTGPGPAQQCQAYEYPVPCIDKCQTCEYKNGHCIQTAECTPGCNCVPGFLRDSTKKCIPASRCP